MRAELLTSTASLWLDDHGLVRVTRRGHEDAMAAELHRWFPWGGLDNLPPWR